VGDGETLLTHLNSALKVLLGLDIFPRVPKKKKLNFVDQCNWQSIGRSGKRTWNSWGRAGDGRTNAGNNNRIFCPAKRPDRLWDAPSFEYSSLGCKSGREVDHSPPHSVEEEWVELHTCSSHTPSSPGHDSLPVSVISEQANSAIIMRSPIRTSEGQSTNLKYVNCLHLLYMSQHITFCCTFRRTSAPSSARLIFNCSTFGATTRCDHLSKRASKMRSSH